MVVVAAMAAAAVWCIKNYSKCSFLLFFAPPRSPESFLFFSFSLSKGVPKCTYDLSYVVQRHQEPHRQLRELEDPNPPNNLRELAIRKRVFQKSSFNIGFFIFHKFEFELNLFFLRERIVL